jgi:hypothetical protein
MYKEKKCDFARYYETNFNQNIQYYLNDFR